MASAALQLVTPQEYLDIERTTETKSEYYNGRIYAMSGASRAHILIVGNVSSSFVTQLRDRPCESYSGDMRVKVSPTGLYTYPDVAVVCEEPQFEDADTDTLLNPAVIVEVLSPSTEAYDRGGKFRHYQWLTSLREYVLISQNRARVERFALQGTEWTLTEVNGLEATLELPSIGCAIPLRDIYAKVRFPVDEANLSFSQE